MGETYLRRARVGYARTTDDDPDLPGETNSEPHGARMHGRTETGTNHRHKTRRNYSNTSGETRSRADSN